MTSVEKRLARLSGRVSREAWMELQGLTQHAKFGDLLAHLEKLDGTLLIKDIERAARHFLDNREERR